MSTFDLNVLALLATLTALSAFGTAYAVYRMVRGCEALFDIWEEDE